MQYNPSNNKFGDTKMLLFNRLSKKNASPPVKKIKIEGYINNYPHYEFDVDNHNEDFWYVPYKDIKKANVQLTENQLMAILMYSQGGVKALENFRNQQAGIEGN